MQLPAYSSGKKAGFAPEGRKRRAAEPARKDFFRSWHEMPTPIQGGSVTNG